MKYPLSLIMLFASLLVIAQTERVTCHQIHNAVKPAALTDLEKELLQKSNQRSDTFDILHYDIHIDVTDYNGQYIKGNTNLDVSPLQAGLSSIRLDLYELQVDSVKVDGLDASYAYDNELLTVNFAGPTEIGTDLYIEVWYQGNPHQDPQWGGFYFENNYIYNLGIGISTIPPNFGKVWYPCFDTFVERATYEFHVLSDDGFQPLAQGELISEELVGEDSVLVHYALDIPIPTYLTSIAAADYVTIAYDHEGAYGTIPVELHAKSGQEGNMETKFQNMGGTIDALEWWFGPYIWNEVGYVMTTVGAMEHPTHIAYPQNMMSAGNVSNEQLYAHELGHLWFGDMVSPDIHNNMWLKEGHAEYSSHLVREWISGEDAFIGEVKDNQLFVLESAHVDDEGFFPLSPIPDEVIYGRHSYYKGAMVVHNLRGYVGDSLFRAGLQGVLDAYYPGHMDPQMYQEAFEASTGADISDFMNDQIFSPGFSTFIIDSTEVAEDGGQWTTTFYIQQKVREAPDLHANVPLDFTLVDADWNKHSQRLVVDGQYATVDISTDFEPLMAMLNGENALNQARTDYEDVLFEETNTLTIPWVDMKLKVDGIGDTAYFRAEHHWVAPDQALISDDILELSETHYWTIGGVWSEGLDLEGRMYYRGFEDHQLDFSLVSETEDFVGLAYRTDPGDEWDIFPYYTLQAGANNGNGTIKLDSIIPGEYAFANIDPLIGIEDFEAEESLFQLFPNPSSDIVYLTTDVPGDYRLQVIDIQGKVVMQEELFLDRDYPRAVDTEALRPGAYSLVLESASGRLRQQLSLVRE